MAKSDLGVDCPGIRRRGAASSYGRDVLRLLSKLSDRLHLLIDLRLE